jgi:predicted nucleic acid-binding protein
MIPVFADAFYFLALSNKSDKAHAQALQFEVAGVPLVTTAWVLTEMGDAFCDPENRNLFLELLNSLYGLPDAKIIPASEELFEHGVELFRKRPDKDWPLTDCISFVVMEDEGISDALTGDKHFEQAGFRALLK